MTELGKAVDQLDPAINVDRLNAAKRKPDRKVMTAQLLFGFFSTVFGTALSTILNASSVQGAADNVVANTGQVFDPSSTNHDHRVLLEVVANTRNVGSYLKAGSQTNPRHFPQGRVGLFGRGGIYAGTHAATLRTTLEGRRFRLIL